MSEGEQTHAELSAGLPEAGWSLLSRCDHKMWTVSLQAASPCVEREIAGRGSSAPET
jgi:hypothetical protein